MPKAPRRLGREFVLRKIKAPLKPSRLAFWRAGRLGKRLATVDVEINRLEVIANTMPKNEAEMRQAAIEIAHGKFGVKRALGKQTRAQKGIDRSEDALRDSEALVDRKRADLRVPEDRLDSRKARLDQAQHLRFLKGIRTRWRTGRVKGAEKKVETARGKVTAAESVVEQARKRIEAEQALYRVRTAAVDERVTAVERRLIAQKQRVEHTLSQLKAESSRLRRDIGRLRGERVEERIVDRDEVVRKSVDTLPLPEIRFEEVSNAFKEEFIRSAAEHEGIAVDALNPRIVDFCEGVMQKIGEKKPADLEAALDVLETLGLAPEPFEAAQAALRKVYGVEPEPEP
ncbi:MAG: hypothetical protein COT15_05025 [Candidatus Diapherotrites archaeon CG08_land_8_20_14_0_20_34_12]|nr:MAG: hypothetical protein COT15_05025 [Candidatus Diapherotrites archaeon CG08_land_8_20_14_0_20_34_12]